LFFSLSFYFLISPLKYYCQTDKNEYLLCFLIPRPLAAGNFIVVLYESKKK
jgi:hypothetical protein